LALHQQAAYELGGNLLGGAGEEALGEGWVVLGGRGGYGSGYGGLIQNDRGILSGDLDGVI
jgi:hypothetical protein